MKAPSCSIRLNALAAALAMAVSTAAMAAPQQQLPTRSLHGTQHTAMQPQTVKSPQQVHFLGFIVKYKQGSTERTNPAARTRSLSVAASRAGLLRARTMANGRTQPALHFTHVRRMAIGADVIHVSRKLTRRQADALMQQLRNDPSVEYVQPNYVRHALEVAPTDRHAGGFMHTQAVTPNDPQFGPLQWDFTDATGGMNAQQAWSTSTGEGIVVAVIDTGYVDHKDLDANIVPGYDFISYYGQTTDQGTYPDVAGDGDGRDPDAHDTGDWIDASMSSWCGNPASNSSWHGTHVAGTVAAVTDNNLDIAGIAHDAKVEPIRVLGHCGGMTSDIADAIVWASGGHVDGVPDNANPAEVINLSLGGSGKCSNDPATQDAIDEAIENGTTVVVAAGNSNADTANFTPASCKGVIAVGAVGVLGAKSWFSNYGPTVAISAPGGSAQTGTDNNNKHWIWSLGNKGAHEPVASPKGDTLIGMVGTSQASPHVAATVALMQSARVSAGLDPLTPAQIKTIIKQTAKPFGTPPPTSTPMGAGILNAAAAVKAATNPDAGQIEATLLENRIPLTGQTGASGDALLYQFTVPEGTRAMVLRTFGGSGDVTAYVSFGQAPTADSHDYASARPGTTETVTIMHPEAGTYYLRVVGVQPFANLNVLGVYQ